jgi:hypothetical protein
LIPSGNPLVSASPVTHDSPLPVQPQEPEDSTTKTIVVILASARNFRLISLTGSEY